MNQHDGTPFGQARAAIEAREQRIIARPIAEYHEDLGDVLWWRWPVTEPPYVGSPLDEDWVEDYYTHWTTFEVPTEAA